MLKQISNMFSLGLLLSSVAGVYTVFQNVTHDVNSMDRGSLRFNLTEEKLGNRLWVEGNVANPFSDRVSDRESDRTKVFEISATKKGKEFLVSAVDEYYQKDALDFIREKCGAFIEGSKIEGKILVGIEGEGSCLERNW